MILIQRNTIQAFVFICIPLFFMALHIETAMAFDSEGSGWCCRGGEIFQSSPEECERERGRVFATRREAARGCEPEKIETEGWCCDDREVFSTVREECQRRRGRYFKSERETLKQCNQIPRISSLEPNIFIKGEPLTLTVRGEKLHDEMVLDFGPGIIVQSIKVDRLKKKAELEIFVEPMAEELERDVILIYGDYKNIINRIMVKATPRTGVDFKEKEVADMEKPSIQQPKPAKGAELKKKSCQWFL